MFGNIMDGVQKLQAMNFLLKYKNVGYLIGIDHERRVIIGYSYWLKEIHIVHPCAIIKPIKMPNNHILRLITNNYDRDF